MEDCELWEAKCDNKERDFKPNATLYMAWGRPEHQPNSCAIKPSIQPNFYQLLRIDARDVYCPTDEPNPAHVGLRAEEKLVPISSSQPDGLVPKLCHLGRHMR